MSDGGSFIILLETASPDIWDVVGISDDELEDVPLDNPVFLPQLDQANNDDQDELLCN